MFDYISLTQGLHCLWMIFACLRLLNLLNAYWLHI